MSRWLLILLALNASVARAEGDSLAVSQGPRSAEEAEVLLTDGAAAFHQGEFQTAVNQLERFIARYPGHKGYLEAHLTLGKALIELQRPDEAITRMRYYVNGARKTDEVADGRIELTRAYLAGRHFNEAYLTALETEKKTPLKHHQPTTVRSRERYAEALILKARAQIGLDQDDRAELTLASGRKAIPSNGETLLQAEANGVALLLKSRSCARFPGPGPLDEGQVRDRLKRRGTCLLEALLLYRKTLEYADTRSAALAESTIETSFMGYHEACANPPEPPPVRPRDRDAKQRSRYRQELVALLAGECRAKVDRAHELLKNWKPSIPATMTAHLDRLTGLLAPTPGNHP